MKHIAIVDFGSQYTHVIARTVREIGVLSRIYPHDVTAQTLADANVGGIILSGGPQSVYGAQTLTADPTILTAGMPILGVCYGHQLLAHLLGGEVTAGQTHEYGKATMTVADTSSPLFADVPSETVVWMSHGDSVVRVPEGFAVIGATLDCAVTAMADERRKIYGIQFHPEVDHSRDGATMLRNFVVGICGMPQEWQMEHIIAAVEEKIRAHVGAKNVFMLISGGVDSNVAFALLTKTLGTDRVRGLLIDTGFMRAGEVDDVVRSFRAIGMDNIIVTDASATFLAAVADVYDPEEKRARIGQTFLTVKDQVLADAQLDPTTWLLGQGTIYPDIIESGGTQNAATIKTHHNRVDAIKEMIAAGLVVEPLADFYKYEVRAIGRELELPDALVDRHPFPGPGLAIRVLNADSTQRDSTPSAEVAREVAECLAQQHVDVAHAIVPIRSVGVQGDQRTYAHPLAVWGSLSWEQWDALSVAMTNACSGINRVVRLLTAERGDAVQCARPAQACTTTQARLDTLRTVDAIVTRHLHEAGIYDAISQCPVVLLPVTDGSEKESIVLRPINTRDFMTADFYRMDEAALAALVRDIMATGVVAHVFYDITNKPPGTTEWE